MTLARLASAVIGGASLAIATAGLVGLWSGGQTEVPTWWKVVYGAVMLGLGIGATAVAFVPRRLGRALWIALACVEVGSFALMWAYFFGAFGGHP